MEIPGACFYGNRAGLASQGGSSGFGEMNRGFESYLGPFTPAERI